MLEKSWILLDADTPKQPTTDGIPAAVAFPIELPKLFIEHYTKPLAVVFDPFAGHGTTVLAAQDLGRIGFGVEYEQARCDSAAPAIHEPSQLFCGDTRTILEQLNIPTIDFVFTSPPYMRSFDTENPLTDYREHGSYDIYLAEMTKIFVQMKKRLAPGAVVCVEVENTFEPSYPMTPLVWDIGKALSRVLFLEREVVVCNTKTPASAKVHHSSVLVFRNK